MDARDIPSGDALPAAASGSEDLAHVARDPDGRFLRHRLDDHLQAVADLAAEFAEQFGAEEWARLAGLWHDLGKFQPAFQEYLRRSSGYDVDGLPERAPVRVDHSSAGAIHAIDHLGRIGPRGEAAGWLLAYAIAGHHAGLPDRSAADGGGAALESRVADRRDTLDSVLGVSAAEPWLSASMPAGGPASRQSAALWTRMVFSALVDADFLDTESFMDAARGQRRSGWKPLQEIAHSFERFMEGAARRDTSVNEQRSKVLDWCRRAADDSPGLFSLTVPTGGGKTLSSMAFALRHALAHGKRRIIYVIPYTSIIEQTADVLRRALGESERWTILLEHHSNLDEEQERHRTRLAAENWDAPVIVTTSVQFFESLFAARTGRVRKLHRIANSVVVLDEVQLLPADYLRPILDVVQALSDHFGTTCLFMTATQPVWSGTEKAPAVPGLRGVREIVPDAEELHRALRRVVVRTPQDLDVPEAWEDVAVAMLAHSSVLCVVNRRQDARVLFEAVRATDAHAVHLSALMCGSHRSQVIASIRARLRERASVRVVSTQLIEAGVAVDFPVVFRAMAGLDSIAQAAGRCNREGELSTGEVRVFVPPTTPPPGILRQAEGLTRTMLAAGLSDVLSPQTFSSFFHQLYWLRGENLDRYGIRDLLDHDGRTPDLSYAFRTAAARFHLIPDENQIPVVVRWGQHPQPERIEDAISAVVHGTPDRWAFRVLQRSLVTVHRWNVAPLVRTGAVTPIHDRLLLQVDPTLYDDQVGLRLDPQEIRDPEELIA